jgi:predicted nucleotidyltransferase
MSGARARFLDRDEILRRLTDRATRLANANPNVLEVSLFGSLARSNHAPGSDADIYVLLREDPRRFVDRIPEFLDAFSEVGVPVEVLAYTVEEFARMEDSCFIRSVAKERVVLAARRGVEDENCG